MTNGIFWSFTGTSLAKAITLLSGILCAHILSKEDYGAFNMVKSTINMFVVLGAGGIGVTVTKYISEYKQHFRYKIPYIYHVVNRFGIVAGFLCTIFVISFSAIISKHILEEPALNFPLKVGSILLFFSILNGVQNGALSGFEDFKSIAKNTFIGSIFEFFFMLIGAYIWGVTGATLGFGIGFLAIYMTNNIDIKKNFKKLKLNFIRLNFRKSHANFISSYTFPATMSALLITPSFWIIRSMLVRANGFEELAIFEAADQWKVVILFIPTTISQIILPILSSIKGQKQTYTRTLVANIIIITIVASFLALILSIFSDKIMGLYGKTFIKTLPLKILAASTIFSAISNVLELSIYSLGKMWQCFIINIIWAVSLIFLTYEFLSYRLGAVGISYSICLSYIITCIIFSIYVLILHKNNYLTNEIRK